MDPYQRCAVDIREFENHESEKRAQGNGSKYRHRTDDHVLKWVVTSLAQVCSPGGLEAGRVHVYTRGQWREDEAPQHLESGKMYGARQYARSVAHLNDVGLR